MTQTTKEKKNPRRSIHSRHLRWPLLILQELLISLLTKRREFALQLDHFQPLLRYILRLPRKIPFCLLP